MTRIDGAKSVTHVADVDRHPCPGLNNIADNSVKGSERERVGSRLRRGTVLALMEIGNRQAGELVRGGVRANNDRSPEQLEPEEVFQGLERFDRSLMPH